MFLIVEGVAQPILGREFMRKFGTGFAQVNEISCGELQLKGLLERYTRNVLFDGNLGKFKHTPFQVPFEFET